MRTASTLLLGLLLLTHASACAKQDDNKPEDKAAAKPGARDDQESGVPRTPAERAPEPYDITKDKSGVLARTASTLETSDRIAQDNPVRGHLAELSHHAEAQASNEKLCAHVTTVRAGTDADACAKTFEHQRVILGPELFAVTAECVLGAKTEAELAACEAAEKQTELLLHEKAHGDGLSAEVCTALFDHFEKLAMADAGDQAEVVKEILEEVRADVVATCQDQGLQDEVDCAMKAETMEALGACNSSLL